MSIIRISNKPYCLLLQYSQQDMTQKCFPKQNYNISNKVE